MFLKRATSDGRPFFRKDFASAALEDNFRKKFEALNRVSLTPTKFQRLLDISTAQQEVEIDLAATHAELVEIERAIGEATKKHNKFLAELGLPLLPSHEAHS